MRSPHGQDDDLHATEPSAFTVNVASDQVDRFRDVCCATGVGFRIGGCVRMRDRVHIGVFREGRSFIFRSREDVQTVLAHEHYLETCAT